MKQSFCFSPIPHNMNATTAFRSHMLKNKPQHLGTLKIGEIVQQISNLFISVERILTIICIPSIFYSDTEDFVPAALEGTFVPAMADEAVCFNVTIMDDTMVESTESFLVNFMSSDSAYLSGGLATISILDNEGDTPCYMLEKI